MYKQCIKHNLIKQTKEQFNHEQIEKPNLEITNKKNKIMNL